MKTMVRQVVPLQPMEVHGGADIHLQPMEDPMPKTCGPAEDPRWSSLFLKDCTLWKGPMLEKFVKDSLPWVRPHTGAGGEREEEGAAETRHDELTITPIHCLPVPWRGGGREFGSEVEPWKKAGPVPMLDNPLGEEICPNIQSKPPLAQLEAISSFPMTCYLEKRRTPTSRQPPFRAIRSPLQLPFLQAKQPQLPQPLLIRLLLQTLHQLRCPSLDTLQHLNVSPGVRGPKMNTAFEVRPHQCRVQGHDHFPSPAGQTIPDTSQDAIGHVGTLLAYIQAAVNQHSQVLLCQAAFQPLFPKPVALHGVVVTRTQHLVVTRGCCDQDPALVVVCRTQHLALLNFIQLASAHRSSLSRSPCRAFLLSSRSILPPNLVSSANLLRVHLIPLSRSLIKILNRTGPSTEPSGTPLVTSCHLDLTPFTTTLWVWPSSQFFAQ
ncbi:hypothetical protein QYF61_002044 [Mycteria americana]|uniref:Uncharacterized protein n=1 Tax=Mycteria americana TaxID=33587 RepID=A0AAN7NKE2_MYCAM|nr:hypothetical protein QYF61_002044 [Mycteria americana]